MARLGHSVSSIRIVDLTSDTIKGTEITQHATCVGLSREAGLLIIGPSGSGKSALALSLMAYGARLVSDDQTILRRAHGSTFVTASAPAAISGMIEARGVGLLAAEPLDHARVRAIVDMSHSEDERLPVERKQSLIGCDIPLLHRVDAPHFAAALIQFLKGGRCA